MSFDARGPHSVVHEDVVYATRDGSPLLARVYRPTTAGGGPFAALVDVHGGAWSYFDRTADAYFDRALPSITNADVRALFEELRGDEIHHIDLVKAELAKLPPGEEPDPDNFVDEPTAQ